MGRGRTTTGMVCAAITMRAATWANAAASGHSPPPPPLPAATSDSRDLTKGEFRGLLRLLVILDDTAGEGAGGGVGAGAGGAGGGGAPSALHAPADLTAGSTTCRRSAVSHGVQAKALADACIEECAEAQHMVMAIKQCKDDAEKATEGAARSPAFWYARGLHYLERYCMLVCFAAYALGEAGGGYKRPFSNWLHHRWQLTRVMAGLTLD